MNRRKFLKGVGSVGALSAVPAVVLAAIPDDSAFDVWNPVTTPETATTLLGEIYKDVEDIMMSYIHAPTMTKQSESSFVISCPMGILNDQTTRNSIVDSVSDTLFQYMRDFSDDINSFAFVSDETNNPPEVIDNNELQASMHIWFNDGINNRSTVDRFSGEGKCVSRDIVVRYQPYTVVAGQNQLNKV